MKPASFQYFRALSVEDTVNHLAEWNGTAKVLAGGQSLLPLLAMRLSSPAALIDINGLEELDYVIREPAQVRLGALVRHRHLESSSELMRALPLIPRAAAMIGHPAIRNRGTLGGSLAHADPAAELPTCLLALDSEVTVVGPSGQRRLPIGDLMAGFMITDLREDELIIEVDVPVPSRPVLSSFQEAVRRHGDFALASVAVVLRLRDDKLVDWSRIVVGATGSMPQRVWSAEELIAGSALTAAILHEAAVVAAESADVNADVHASESYRRQLIRVLVERALTDAVTPSLPSELEAG